MSIFIAVKEIWQGKEHALDDAINAFVFSDSSEANEEQDAIELADWILQEQA